MLGETQRLLGDLRGAEASLREGLAAAERAPAYDRERAMAHNFLARTALDGDDPERALRHYRDAEAVLAAARDDEYGVLAGRALLRLHVAEAQLFRGRRSQAELAVRQTGRTHDRETRAKLAMLRHVIAPDAHTTAELHAALAEVREREVTVFIDLCVAVARLGASPSGVESHLRSALQVLRSWGNVRLASHVRRCLSAGATPRRTAARPPCP
jgi:hypothetical protein